MLELCFEFKVQGVSFFIYLFLLYALHFLSQETLKKIKLLFISPLLSSCLSLNQGLLLEQERLMSDYDKLKAEEQEKDGKLQKLM